MTDINHRRKNKKQVNQRYSLDSYNNGYARPENKETTSGVPRVGRTDFLDKSMHSWGRKSNFADKYVGAGIANDFTNGHKGMAKAVKGAKKFVKTRIRFHENLKLKKLCKNIDE